MLNLNNMNCLVVSDTHTNIGFYKECLSRYLPNFIDVVIHLGDNYRDALTAYDYNHKLICVPGTRCSQYQDRTIDNRRIEIFNSWRCLLSHTPTRDLMDLELDIDPQECMLSQQCDVLLHGHTHLQNVEKKRNVVILNPGHLKSQFDRGQKPSYMIVKFHLNTLTVSCYDFITHKCKSMHEFKK